MFLPSAKPMSLACLAPKVLDHLKMTQVTTFIQAGDYVIALLESPPVHETTIRRRVYDILNVFLACNLITKSNGKIKWKARTVPSTISRDHEIHVQTLNKKRQEFAKSLRVLVRYRSLIDQNRLIRRPPRAIQLTAIFVGYRNVANGSSDCSLDGKKLTITSSSPPIFYSPMDVLSTRPLPPDEQLRIVRSLGFDPALLDVQ
jgi:hypothetical protein